MSGFNQVTLIGNLVKDPDLRRTGNGTPVCAFRLAVDDVRRGRDGEPVTETLFIDAICFGSSAEASNAALYKGSRVFVQGKLRQVEWTDRDGSRRSQYRVEAQRIEFLGAPRAAEAPAAPFPGSAAQESPARGGADIPFRN
ncbi:MAG: single-stranded DNA-binding protein [Kiritimatiellae bacterium]|nr:single-stranded DNA-binding protein [Kiritimatiellia bacterium]